MLNVVSRFFLSVLMHMDIAHIFIIDSIHLYFHQRNKSEEEKEKIISNQSMKIRNFPLSLVFSNEQRQI